MSRSSKILTSVILSGLMVLSILVPIKINAADVKLSATVVERRPTDTINDFDFNNLNPNGQDKIYL